MSQASCDGGAEVWGEPSGLTSLGSWPSFWGGLSKRKPEGVEETWGRGRPREGAGRAGSLGSPGLAWSEEAAGEQGGPATQAQPSSRPAQRKLRCSWDSLSANRFLSTSCYYHVNGCVEVVPARGCCFGMLISARWPLRHPLPRRDLCTEKHFLCHQPAASHCCCAPRDC